MKMSPLTIGMALIFSLLIPALGYIFLGALVGILFLIGYFGGFILWFILPQRASYFSLRVPYWLTFIAFLLLHKTEENATRFFQVLSDRITGVPVPELSPILIVGLLVLPIGAWILGPFLLKRGYDFGYFLAWTLFSSMGITELAHFVFPLMTSKPYGYFPGMASVLVLAPLAWWGIWRMVCGSSTNSPSCLREA